MGPRFVLLEGKELDWSTLVSTFGLVFVAELGDKTQLAVVTQICKHRRPWAVFLGASGALTATTAIGAVGGQLLGQVIPETLLRVVAASAFIVMGMLIGREAVKAGRKAPQEDAQPCTEDEQVDCVSVSTWDWWAFSSTFGVLFVAELGDKTQLAVLSLAGECGDVWPVFVGGALALALVTGLGVVGGQGLCRLIPERLLLWISAVAFVVMGALMGLGVL
jgi:putative Ca2+/H+ antiporter (TMEM165/GDT1 family)